MVVVAAWALVRPGQVRLRWAGRQAVEGMLRPASMCWRGRTGSEGRSWRMWRWTRSWTVLHLMYMDQREREPAEACVGGAWARIPCMYEYQQAGWYWGSLHLVLWLKDETGATR